MIATYRVRFGGRLVPGYALDQVRDKLMHHEGFDQARLDTWFAAGGTVLSTGLSFEAAIELRERYARQGALCEIEAENNPIPAVSAASTSLFTAAEPDDPLAAAPLFEPLPLVTAGPSLDDLRRPSLTPGLWFIVSGGLSLFDWYYCNARALGQAAGRETLKLLIPGYNLVLIYRQLCQIEARVGGFSPARVLAWLVLWMTCGLSLLVRYSLWWPVYFLAGLALVRVQRAVNQDRHGSRPAAALVLTAVALLAGLAYAEYRLADYNRTQLAAFARLDPGRYGSLRLAGDETLVFAARLVYLERAKYLMNDLRLSPANRYRVLEETLKHLEPYTHPTGPNYYLMVDYLRQDNRFVRRHREARQRLNSAILAN